MSEPSTTGAPELPTLDVDTSTTHSPTLAATLGSAADAHSPTQAARLQERRKLPPGPRKVSDAAAVSESAGEPVSPVRSTSPLSSDPASPHRMLRSASPRHLSPATSMIFERDVQEPVSLLPPDLAPAVPAHIQTEDHIPAVLEASSLAITDEKLGPDDVEIVMHTAHQPAMALGTSSSVADLQSLQSPATIAHSDAGWDPHDGSTSGAVSTYGTLDTTDPRRLSFISFADVVHAEQVEHAEITRDPLSLLGLSAAAGASIAGNRSPSPIRSPPLGTLSTSSPPLAASERGFESPIRTVGPFGSSLGSASSPHPGLHPAAQTHGELTIETMRQTLEKTSTSVDLTAQGLAVPAAAAEESRS